MFGVIVGIMEFRLLLGGQRRFGRSIIWL